MIVITILAILVAAGMPTYISYLQRAAVTEAVGVLGQYKLALGMFWSIQERLPTTGDTLSSTPADLPFGTLLTNTTANPLPDSIESLQLTASGNGVLITAVVQGNVFSSIAVNNRTIVLGALPNGNELLTECGNFTTDAATITDIGFTNTAILPTGCSYNGVGAWLES